MTDNEWPPLPLSEWRDTYENVHLWTQIVGKIRLARTALINHWWNTTLYLTARGLTTSPMRDGDRAFEIAFDFVDHRLLIDTSSGERRSIDLRPQPCADFYSSVMQALDALGIEVHITPITSEIPNPVRLDEDRAHDSYDADAMNRCWRIMLSTSLVMQEFRSRFMGKASAIHFFWGSFDLALTFFSGRRAPAREGADAMMREAYSHEVSSCGWWPGGGAMQEAAFYAYAAPQPEGYDRALARYYNSDLKEPVLMYDEVRASSDPRKKLLDFFNETYEAAANLGHWNRAELERS